MMFEALLLIYSFIAAIGTGLLIVFNFVTNREVQLPLLCACFFFTLLLFFLMGVFDKKPLTKEQIKEQWKFKDYKAVEDYLENEKPYLKYEQEDKDRLVILLFFDWMIIDDSDPEKLILHRKTTSSDDTQVFQPLNKKSL